VEIIFFFSKLFALIAAGSCLPIFFLRCWPRAVPLKKTKPKLWAAWLGTTFGVIALLCLLVTKKGFVQRETAES